MFVFIYIALVSFLLLPLVFILLFLMVNPISVRVLRALALVGAGILFIYVGVFFIFLPDFSMFGYFFFYKMGFLVPGYIVVLGLDSINVYFLLLSVFILYICLLSCWHNALYNFNLIFYILLYFQEFLIQLVFVCFDVLLFFFFFEGLLLTLFLMIGLFGTRRRKIRAGFLLLLYTIFGSVLMLVALCYLLLNLGSTNFIYMYMVDFSIEVQKFLWIAFFLTFAIKVPMFPFHVWLPEAHVEAPTFGSVILAGVLLKVGTYGILRFVICLFPKISLCFSPYVCTLATVGLVYSSLCAVCQLDLKRIIAYSSISHMNLIVLGLFSFDLVGLEGCILQMLNHGVVSGGLFLGIGILYDRYHTRVLRYMGGMVVGLPLFTFIILVVVLGNIAIPGTCSFLGEFLIFLSLFGNAGIVLFISLVGMILSGIYTLWLFNRLCFGNSDTRNVKVFIDINFAEFCIFLSICLFVVCFGVAYFFGLSHLTFSLQCILISCFIV